MILSVLEVVREMEVDKEVNEEVDLHLDQQEEVQGE